MPEYEMREEVVGEAVFNDGKPLPLVVLRPKAIVTEIQYPKSLGELCLEELSNACLFLIVHGYEKPVHYRDYWGDLNIKVPSDSNALRVAMYHKNRSEE